MKRIAQLGSDGRSPSEQIDAMIKGTPDWRGRTLARLRRVILGADPRIIEEVKWRKPSNPDGVPVWTLGGILCVGNVLKNAVRLTFTQGPKLRDPKGLFNTRLDSKVVRAIDVREGEKIDEMGLRAIVREAVRLNKSEGPRA